MSMPTDFEWEYTEEPHATRRKLILAKYPEVRELYGPHWLNKYVMTATVLLQVFCAYMVSLYELSWTATIVLAYTLGGVCNHSLTLAMHEVSHNLAFRKFWVNKWFGFFVNAPLGIPAFASFKRYHADHHKYQGEDGVDTDVPTVLEGRIFRTPVAKVIWMIIQPLFYALRPMVVVPKVPTVWELMNLILQASFDFAVFYFWGPQALVYLLLSTLLGMGVHPMAGHFVAEHYAFVKGQETYSYYGPLNFFSYFVGYHNEHHDFPFIPGFRLPELRALCPEFYDTMPRHSSWTKVIWQYIVDPSIGPFSRIKRRTLDDKTREGIRRR